jgi:hypothetical protein
LFRCFDPISKQPKQTEIFVKIPKSALYQNVSVGLLFVSVQSKQTNSLFHYRSKTTETNCFETNRNNPKFSEKYQNMIPIKLFWFVFCLFRFNLNTETRCFGEKRNNRNKRLVSDSPKTSFGSSFGCFKSKLVLKDILVDGTSAGSGSPQSKETGKAMSLQGCQDPYFRCSGDAQGEFERRIILAFYSARTPSRRCSAFPGPDT